MSIKICNGNTISVNGNYKNVNFISNTIDKIKFKDVNTNYTFEESTININFNTAETFEFKSIKNYSNILIKGGKYKYLFFLGEFHNSIEFNESLNVETLWIESSTFKNRIDIKEGIFDYIFLLRNDFENLIWIHDYDIIGKISKDMIQIKRFSMHSNTFKKNINMAISNLKNIDLSNNKFEEIFNLTTNYSSISNDEVNISFDGVNSGSIVFEDIKCDIYLNFINFGNIYFKDLAVSHITIKDTQNNGNLSFSNIKNADLLIIQGSNMGETEFLNTDFKNFCEIVITESNISKINFSDYFFNVRSYTKNPRTGYGIIDKDKNYNNLRKVYNQLKKIAFNKGDIDTGYRYQALEYENLLREKNIFSVDKSFLLLNYLSNDNGHSWLRGIGFTIIVSIFSFLIYTFYTNTCFDFPTYIYFMTSFPKLHIIDYTSWKIELITWFARIFIGYGIYQTIAAFRKYGKN